MTERKPRVVINVVGGVAHLIAAPFDVEVLIADFDTLKDMGVPDQEEVELIRGDVRILVGWAGEGWHGDYNPEDKEDAPLARFWVYRNRPEGWVDVSDGSYCTAFPLTQPLEMKKVLAEYLMDEFYEMVTECESIKKRGEVISWINEKTLEVWRAQHG